MIYSSPELKEAVRELWPRLRAPNLVWPRATKYKMYDDIDHVKEVVRINSVSKKYHYVKGGYECEFRATQLMAAVWEYQYRIDVVESGRIPEEADQYFFGLCLGFRFKTYYDNHNVNIAFFGKREIALIDASEDFVWTPVKVDDPYMIFR